MSRIIDITDKLNFTEKPKIKVRDIEVEANNDAVTMLKVAALMEGGDDGKFRVKDMLSVFNLLFDEENREKVEALKLDMDDFTTFVVECATQLVNNGSAEGEAPTPATT